MSVTDFQYTYELSPITLVNGIAQNMPGGSLPIVSLTQAVSFSDGTLGGTSDLAPSDFFAHFSPAPGGTLLEFDFGDFPFANQTVAANAAIGQPLVLQMLMVCPAKGEGGYAVKQSIMTALQQRLIQHVSLGGTFNVATVSFIYTNLLLKSLKDLGAEGEDKQVQSAWMWDFWQPLLTVTQANQAQNSLVSKISAGGKVPMNDNGAVPWSGLAATTGQPTSVAAPSVVPAASGAGSAGVAAPQGPPFS